MTKEWDYYMTYNRNPGHAELTGLAFISSTAHQLYKTTEENKAAAGKLFTKILRRDFAGEQMHRRGITDELKKSSISLEWVCAIEWLPRSRVGRRVFSRSFTFKICYDLVWIWCAIRQAVLLCGDAMKLLRTGAGPQLPLQTVAHSVKANSWASQKHAYTELNPWRWCSNY